MDQQEEFKLKALIKKYNPVLLHGMSIALAEDLVRLIISNQEDGDFELRNIINEKEEFKAFVVKEFLKQNSSINSVINELKSMDEVVFKTKDAKLKDKKMKDKLN